MPLLASPHMSPKAPQPVSKHDQPTFPMRINKYLASKGYSTRREADTLITKKQVFINGRIAVLGDKVMSDDDVEVRTGAGKSKKNVYFAYNKPVGIVTHSAQAGEKEIMQSVHIKGIAPIGRLDKDSHGLIILTNDGRITDRLLNPEHEHVKEYIVEVKTKLRPTFKEYMERGVDIEGYITKPCKVKILGDKVFAISISEGKKHQIRRMVAALFNEVVDLQRIKVMNIQLGGLALGRYRAIEGEELTTFLKSLGL
ncbi:MAG: pseudouridylate synthase specific to ribosomal small subunit, rRNA pseudouridine2604 synthase [Candidatus Parcubacteria bacterium]|jgi:23S rRNA pseudouridine2604 synthase